MFVTIVDADVEADREPVLMTAWQEITAADPLPAGLVQSTLLRGQDGHWRIITTWESREAVVAMRSLGARPAALAMFERAGARPEVSMWQAEGHVTSA